MRACAVKAFLCLLFVCAGLRCADAHAYVVSTVPGIGASVDASPARVTVSFDEPVTLESKTPLVVRGQDGTIDECTGGARMNPDEATQVACVLAAPLDEGTYTVSWRVTSADTHVVHGVFSFGVRQTASARAGETSSPLDPSGTLATLLRWLVLLGSIAIAGGIGFDRFVLRRKDVASEPAAVRTMRSQCTIMVSAGVLAAVPASGLALVVQAAAATDTDLVHALLRLDEVLRHSTWGLVWVLRMAALALVVGSTGEPRRPTNLAAAGGAALLLLTLSLSGHALVTGALGPSAFAVLADWLHLAGAGLWGGGLFVLALGIGPARAPLATLNRDIWTRATISGFSDVAIASVVTIVLTGVLGSVIHVASWSELVTSSYGRIILLKVALLVPLLVLGARNYRRGREGSSPAGVTTAVAYEAMLITAVVALSAILAGLPLPHPTH